MTSCEFNCCKCEKKPYSFSEDEDEEWMKSFSFPRLDDGDDEEPNRRKRAISSDDDDELPPKRYMENPRVLDKPEKPPMRTPYKRRLRSDDEDTPSNKILRKDVRRPRENPRKHLIIPDENEKPSNGFKTKKTQKRLRFDDSGDEKPSKRFKQNPRKHLIIPSDEKSPPKIKQSKSSDDDEEKPLPKRKQIKVKPIHLRMTEREGWKYLINVTSKKFPLDNIHDNITGFLIELSRVTDEHIGVANAVQNGQVFKKIQKQYARFTKLGNNPDEAIFNAFVSLKNYFTKYM